LAPVTCARARCARQNRPISFVYFLNGSPSFRFVIFEKRPRVASILTYARQCPTRRSCQFRATRALNARERNGYPSARISPTRARQMERRSSPVCVHARRGKRSFWRYVYVELAGTSPRKPINVLGATVSPTF